ncbi:DUF1722 domain-containing protein [Bacillus sp. H-16]|nr:DUF1722 domain-containing protein [Alteribacter salitolerans]
MTVPFKKLTEKLWARNKYEIMAKGYRFYKDIQISLREAENCREYLDVYLEIKKQKELPFSHGDFLNTCEHIWGYFKHKTTESEKEQFFTLFNHARSLTAASYTYFPPECRKCAAYLAYLLELYPVSYLKESSVFLPENKWNVIKINNEYITVTRRHFSC